MKRITIDITPESVADLLARLPPEQLRLVLDNLSHKIEVREWMRLSEAGFEEWLAEPDLYGDEPRSR